MVAYWAHNPVVAGSSPASAKEALSICVRPAYFPSLGLQFFQKLWFLYGMVHMLRQITNPELVIQRREHSLA